MVTTRLIKFYFYHVFSNCSLNSLNCNEISNCHTERSIPHTPPNQDGRATPSPEHVSTAESEDLHNYEDDHTSVLGETCDNFPLTGRSDSSTATNSPGITKETEQTDENFNSFHYWRPPLPDISGELEMLNCPTATEKEEELEENCPDSKSSHGKATSDQIQKVLDCLQPHIADPDVQGE